MLRPGNLDRGEPTNEVEHVKVTDRMTNKRPRMKLPDGAAPRQPSAPPPVHLMPDQRSALVFSDRINTYLTADCPTPFALPGFGHVTFGVLPNSRGVFTYTNSGILVSANEEALLPAEFRDTSLVMGLCAVIEYGPSAPLPTADKCNILDGHPLVVKKARPQRWMWRRSPACFFLPGRPLPALLTTARVSAAVRGEEVQGMGCSHYQAWRRRR